MASRRQAFAFIVIFFAVAAVLHLNPSSRFSWTALMINVACWFVACHIAVFAHELAHAVVARAVGLRPFQIDVGYGRSVVQTVLAGLLLVVRPLPSGGVTYFAARSAHYTRLRLLATYAAGPIWSGVLAAAASCGLHEVPAVNELRTRPLPLALFFVANAFTAMTAFPIPRRVSAGPDQPPSDGWQILTLAAKSDEDIRRLIDANDVADAMIAATQRRWVDVRAACESVLGRKPDHLVGSILLAGALLAEGDYARARDLYLALLGRSDANAKPLRAVLENNLAWTYAMLGDPAHMEEAARLSERALCADPRSGAYLGTRGAVLLELGRVEEAVRLLEKARARNERHNQALNHCLLAVARSRLANPQAALHDLHAAERLDANCVLLPRARQACLAPVPP
jgi:hypothetical protein